MTESAVTNTKNLGCVKWFIGKRGYGFITGVVLVLMFLFITQVLHNKDCWKF